MKLSDYLVCSDLNAETKLEAIKLLVDILVDNGKLHPEEKTNIIDAVITREELGNTSVGNGVAIPHAKCFIDKPCGIIGVCKNGVDFNSIDGELVYTIILIISPNENRGEHLKTLSEAAVKAKDKNFQMLSRYAKSDNELKSLLS